MIELSQKAATGSRGVGIFLFVFWGVCGLGLSIFAALGAPAFTAITVALLWIGGVLFFGMCVLLASVSYRFNGPALPVYVVTAPRPDGLNEVYNGVAYMRLESGQVIAEFADGKHTFKSWEKFVEAVPD
jgi:hypothetical protein